MVSGGAPHLRDARPVVVRERPVGQDGVGHLGVGDQVDLKQLGLEGTLLGLVTLGVLQGPGVEGRDEGSMEGRRSPTT